MSHELRNLAAFAKAELRSRLAQDSDVAHWSFEDVAPTVGAALEVAVAKVLQPELEHWSCESRVRQAVLDAYLVITDPAIRQRFEAEEIPHD